jgi:hypothetical protein
MFDLRVPVSDRLVAPCDLLDGKIRVANLDYFQHYNVLKIGEELLLVEKVGKRRLRVKRGIGGTVAQTHSPGDTVYIIGIAIPESVDLVAPGLAPLYRAFGRKA